MGTVSSRLNCARSHRSESVKTTETSAANSPSSAYQTSEDELVSV